VENRGAKVEAMFACTPGHFVKELVVDFVSTRQLYQVAT